MSEDCKTKETAEQLVKNTEKEYTEPPFWKLEQWRKEQGLTGPVWEAYAKRQEELKLALVAITIILIAGTHYLVYGVF